MLIWILACAPPDDPVDAPPLPDEGQVSVLTYNVQGLPDPLTELALPTAERMARISPMLEDFDVVGLQEDFDPANHDLLTAQATHADREWFDAPVDPTRVYGAGLALLSRLGSASDYQEQHYAQCAGVFDSGSDCLASKGFQVLTLDLGGGALLDVYNTHHEAGGGDDDDLARRSQVLEVLAAMDGPSAGRAVLFMGDTNLRWTDPEDVDELQLYADAGLRDACDEVACAEGDHIDRFLVRDGDDLALEIDGWDRDEAFVDEDGADLSDHPAITTELSWSRR